MILESKSLHLEIVALLYNSKILNISTTTKTLKSQTDIVVSSAC